MTETIRLSETTEIDVCYDLGERQTRDEPGCDPSYEIVVVRVRASIRADIHGPESSLLALKGDALGEWVNVTDVIDAFGIDLMTEYEAKIEKHFSDAAQVEADHLAAAHGGQQLPG